MGPFQPDHIPPDGGGLVNHREIVGPVPAVLDVVAVISNPVRYRSRYDLYRAFARHVRDSGARLTTVELAYGDRPFEVTESGNPRHVRFRTGHELWHKENLINLGIQRLPAGWSRVAWIDADLTFQRPDWVQETLQQLEHYDVVQPFSHSINMGPNYHPIFDSIKPNPGADEQRKIVASWLYCHVNRIPRDGSSPKHPLRDGQYLATGGRHFWHPGFAWAARRSAIETMGGLLDWAIVGSADRHMAEMMTGKVGLNPKLSDGYRQLLQIHQSRVDRLRGNFGYVDGLVTHHWHGKLANRFYLDRWKILYQHQFDPITDLHRDAQGVWQLTPDKPGLRDDLRAYFRARNEDSIDA